MTSLAAVTVIIPTFNEGERIGPLVRGLDWAAGVIVADGGSRDDTVERAREAGALVLENTGPTIAAQRNAAIARAATAWVFALDADEEIGPELRDELAAVVARPAHEAYAVRRRNFYLGRELQRGHWGRDWVTRLFPATRRYLERRVHEALEPVADTGRLRHPLVHVPYRDLSEQLTKIERYARWGALDLHDRGRRATVWDVTARPAGKFLRSWLLDGAWRDGRAGWISARLGAWGTFLKYAYLWALERRDPHA